MSDINIGQKVHNCRTDSTAKVLDIVERWTGRHTTRKLKVETIHGDIKEWSFSTCKVVEEEAPRGLVLLKNLLIMSDKHKDVIKQEVKSKFNQGGSFCDLTGCFNAFNTYLKNAESFRELSLSNFGLLITFVCLERNLNRISVEYGGGLNPFINDLLNIYGDRKEYII